MVEAFHKNIIFPNKQIERDHTFTADGHLIDSETYVGARVESLESGVFRSDIPVKFRLDVERLQKLKVCPDVLLTFKTLHFKVEVHDAMQHTLVAEMGVSMDELVDFDEICQQVQRSLDVLIETPQRHENPNIYHLDVGAM
jgi:DNA polymerase epsilon subunit 1